MVPYLAIIVQKRKREALPWGRNSEMNCQNLNAPRARSQKLDAPRGLDQLDKRVLRDNLGSEGGRRPACVLSIKKFRIFDRKLWRCVERI
jgi:hypothetical protein